MMNTGLPGPVAGVECITLPDLDDSVYYDFPVESADYIEMLPGQARWP